jgi:uncharacterized 2Fe-2S/4Fe-4S cluster protein (DUF4445 family)
MLLNKDCKCGGDCTCNKITVENQQNEKELLGSFDHKIPVLEISKHNYKVIKDSPEKNKMLFS